MPLARLAATLTVGQKAALTVAVGVALLAAAIALTALVVPVRVALALWLAALLLTAAAAAFGPLRLDRLAARPRPCADHDAAVARFHAEAEPSPEPLNPLCHPGLLTHGARTRRAVVLLHGISSCPRAFVDFAPQAFADGANVVSLRMPENGYADRATDALGRLTAEALRDWGDLAVDLGAGLGDEVVVLGISAGGTVAAWCAQNRREVACAVVVAPMFGLSSLGPRLNAAIMRATLFLPDFSIWKDPILRARFQGMPHAYLRQSSRATGQILRLAAAVARAAAAGPARAGGAALVTNANDTAVDNAMAGAVADAWARHGLAVVRHEFPKALGLGHEVIDPLEPGADPAVSYPVLLALVAGRPVPPAPPQ